MTARAYELWIDGARTPAVNPGARLERRSPATGEVVASWPAATEHDVARAVAAAKAAGEAAPWRDASGAQRASLLLAAADAIAAREDELARILVEEVGKPAKGALAEVREGIALWRYAASALRALHGESYPELAPGIDGMTLLEPVGVVGLVVPWNFPFIVAAERLPFMLAAGCTVVEKPSEHTSGAALFTAEVLHAAGVPRGVYNVVTGWGHEAGAALVASPDVAMISFTGSTENGKRVMEAASRTLKRVSLELGGKSPVVVFADAALDEAIDGVVAGFTENAGQCCIATSRLLVEASVAERFSARLAERLGELAAAGAFVQPAATDAQHAKVRSYIELGAREGTLVRGRVPGGDPKEPIAPTVIAGLPPSSRVIADEVFGPVLSVQTFAGEDEAIRLANDTAFGLAACVWSGDVARAWRVARRIKAGRLWINSAQRNFPELPVGGYGASGIGREAGTLGIRTYSEVKSVIARRQP